MRIIFGGAIDVEEIRRFFDPFQAALRQLEGCREFLQQPFVLQPLARRFQVPGIAAARNASDRSSPTVEHLGSAS